MYFVPSVLLARDRRVDMAVDVRSFYGVKRPRSSAANEEEEQNTTETVGLLRNPLFIGYY